MIRIKINGKELMATEGLTIYQVAVNNGISIPVMCFNPDAGHFASCMICVVRERKTGKMLTSCSVMPEEGMDIITDDDEIHEARRLALELLLSDHVGDCEAPCRIACPAHMDIPFMNRLMAEGKFSEALEVVRKDIALPSVLGRICPAPCEGACRRKPADGAVNICLLKKFAGDEGKTDLIKAESSGKKVAVIGSGPAGLAAAFYLELKGIHAMIFDRNEKPGGALRYSVPDERLEKSVLDREIDIIRSAGAEFKQAHIDLNGFKRLTDEFDAVVVATGDLNDEVSHWGIDHNGKQIVSDKKTHQTNIPKVFAIGNVNRPTRFAVRSAGQGKEVAYSIQQFLSGEQVTGEYRMFNSRFGKLLPEEYEVYLSGAAGDGPSRLEKTGNNCLPEEIQREASRCMHCDCRKKDDCKLRIHSGTYNARQTRFEYGARMPVRMIRGHDLIVYEPEKCIKCGICIRISANYKEKFGFTFIGRGFDVEVGVPFNKKLNEAFTITARMVAGACPTGALALIKN